MRTPILILTTTALLLAVSACKTNNKTSNTVEEAVSVPEFNADSAYRFVKAQVDFGPRVPNTKEHKACGEYLATKLEAFGATVTNQYADLITFDGTTLKARNIIGAFAPENKRRILLFAHWDTRPWADADPDKKNHHTPIAGANDGASGVGVLLEIARQIGKQAPRMGIDIIFFDAEDYGQPYFSNVQNVQDSWALGAQYWARYPHVQNYNARFGILLDMVGGKDATFYREGYSEQYAKHINKKVWSKARELGYGNFFIDEVAGYVTDDHYYINKILGIPSIDIIANDASGETSSFGDFWHTMRDNMDIIDPATLQAVGQTVLAVIYNEK